MAKKKVKAEAEDVIGCQLKELPEDALVQAAEIAGQENPTNRPPEFKVMAMIRDGEVDIPQAIAVLTTKNWGTKGVKLGVWMDTTNSALKNKILGYMNWWRTKNPKGANVTFSEASFGMAQVRISFDNTGYWSYLGTDILSPGLAGRPTMNLQGFSLSTPDAEYARVVTHETGHTLGMPHEHMRAEIINRLDRTATINYFMRTQGWSQQDVIQQVLTPLREGSLLDPTPTDDRSVMCYVLPASITRDGRAIPGGNEPNAQDYEYVSKIYPASTPTTPPPQPTGDKVRIAFDFDEKTNAVSNVVVTVPPTQG